MSDKNLTFHIDNLAYTISVDTALENDLLKYLTIQRSMSTKELLVAYIRMTQELNEYKEEIKKLSNKLSNN